MIAFHMFKTLTAVGEPRSALLSGDVAFGDKTLLVG